MIENLFEHFFKPDVRAAAAGLIAKDVIYLKLGSDTQIEASVRASTPVRVAFRSASIASREFSVDCTCRPSKNGQFCKHIWATLVLAAKKSPDFFDSKESISKASLFATPPPSEGAEIRSQKQIDFESAQSAYRKEAYQKQKVRAKEIKAARAKGEEKSSESKLSRFLPESVQTALKYFEQNGFPLSVPVNPSALSEAKRILSRVFHPDKGGSQDEILELLHHADVLSKHR